MTRRGRPKLTEKEPALLAAIEALLTLEIDDKNEQRGQRKRKSSAQLSDDLATQGYRVSQWTVCKLRKQVENRLQEKLEQGREIQPQAGVQGSDSGGAHVAEASSSDLADKALKVFSTQETCLRQLITLERLGITAEGQTSIKKAWQSRSCIKEDCGGAKWPLTERGFLKCCKRHKTKSPLASTIFANTHKPLPLWFRAIWYYLTTRPPLRAGITIKGGSIPPEAFGLPSIAGELNYFKLGYRTRQLEPFSIWNFKKFLGLSSTDTAHNWIRKIQEGMSRGEPSWAAGDEEEGISFGDVKINLKAHDLSFNLWIISSRNSEARACLWKRKSQSSQEIHPDDRKFIERCIKQTTTVYTYFRENAELIEKFANKVFSPYSAPPGGDHLAFGVPVEIPCIPLEFCNAAEKEEGLPRVGRTAALLYMWLSAMQKGSITESKLQHYIDEFSTRFNSNGHSQRRGIAALFPLFLQKAVTPLA